LAALLLPVALLLALVPEEPLPVPPLPVEALSTSPLSPALAPVALLVRLLLHTSRTTPARALSRSLVKLPTKVPVLLQTAWQLALIAPPPTLHL